MRSHLAQRVQLILDLEIVEERSVWNRDERKSLAHCKMAHVAFHELRAVPDIGR